MTFWGAFNSNLHTLFMKITPKTGLLTRKCALNCNFHIARTQFKRRIVLERIRYITSTLSISIFLEHCQIGKEKNCYKAYMDITNGNRSYCGQIQWQNDCLMAK